MVGEKLSSAGRVKRWIRSGDFYGKNHTVGHPHSNDGTGRVWNALLGRKT